MPVYEYQGLDDGGRKTSGLVDADSARAARQKLRKQGVFTTSIAEGKAASGSSRRSPKGNTAEAKPKLNKEIDLSRFIQQISIQDVALATRQLAALLGAGIPLVESLSALSEQVEKTLRYNRIVRRSDIPLAKAGEGSDL